METTERTTKGLTFTVDESTDGDQFPVCVYDAEGVRVHTNDRIERVLLSVVDTTRTRRFGTVVGITVDWIIVRWDDTPGATFGVAMDVVENFCRVVLEDTTPPDPVEIMIPSREDTKSHLAICRRFEEYCETKGIDVTLQFGDRLSRTMDLARVTETMNVDWEGLLSTDVSNFIHDVMGIHRHMDRSVGELGDCFVPRFARSTT